MNLETGNIPTLESGRLVLRPLSGTDVDALRRVSNELLVRRYLWDDEPVSKAKIEELVAQSTRMFLEEGLGLFGVRLRGGEELVGFCGFLRLEGMEEPELAYELVPDLWGRGLATEAAQASMRYAFDMVGRERVIAGADAPNIASLRVMEKLGMRPIGGINSRLPEDPYFALYRDNFFAPGAPSGPTRTRKVEIVMTESDKERTPVPGSKVRPTKSDEQIVRANGVDLCVQTFGNPADPAILLIAGTACSMDWWEDEFCERLAAGSRFVVRYDHRDTGRSVSYEPGAPPYTLRDLEADAVGVLDALNLESAHLAGMSMGGWIGQLAALDRPDRVASLTLISTRPTAHGPNDPDLPEMSEELQALLSEEEAAEPNWADREAVIAYIVEGERPFAGSLPFDEAAKRGIVARVFDRTINLASSMTNHFLIDGGDRWRERLGEIGVPTLVVHGTEDPLFPYGNALALGKEIPGARLLALERMGHETPPRAVWDIVVPAILEHTSDGPESTSPA